MEEDRTVFLTFANVWNLLNIFRAVGSGYAVQLHGDVTFKASKAALNKLGFGVNMLGSHFAPVSYTLIPAESESSEAYKQAWRATKAAARRIMSLRLCDSEDCKTCTYIREVKENETVAACLAGRPYMIDKELPISYPLGDNSAAWQKFCREELQVPTNVCQTHATAIAANNGSHKTHFDNMARYEEFYEYVCRIMRCSFVDAGERLQELLVQFLRSVGETRAADWFSEWWCGPVKGRWLLGHGGICITPNNSGMESTWRWDRHGISRGREVRYPAWRKRDPTWRNSDDLISAGGPCTVPGRHAQDHGGC